MLDKLMAEVDELKEMVRNSIYNFTHTARTEINTRARTQVQDERLAVLCFATVVDTVDPLKQGGIRFYSPSVDVRDVNDGGLPWAYPISPFGGFDDSGSIWVPPAGSKVAILYHNGDPDTAYYIGTVWQRDRGKDGQHTSYWDKHPVPEYDCLWDGKRNGYLVGAKDGSQVFPPWNTESYNGYDTDSKIDFYKSPQQYSNVTNPNIKGFKTEEKHYWKAVDGDPKCNRRWKRLEMSSSRGNVLLFKDDHLHPAGQWAFSNAPLSQDDPITFCFDLDKNAPKEFACCASDATEPKACTTSSCAPKECPEKDETHSTVQRRKVFANPFYKRKEEMRLYEGAKTPMKNKCDLEQSGVHLQSISGHQFVMDDKVNQPTGVPTWDRDFDFGCDDKYLGKMFLRSATGHIIEISDQESESKVRGEENYIRLKSASGSYIEINDHTLQEQQCEQKIAGEKRGISMKTTSEHLFQMIDHRLEQASEPRKDGGEPNKASKSGFKGFCLLRSGYGLQLLMEDKDRQDKTANQFIQLLAPQKDNTERGPHMFVMQEKEEGPGLVMLRAGGAYHISSYDDSLEVVGSEDNPSNKLTSVTNSYNLNIKENYINKNGLTIYLSKSYIFLMAGEDCEAPKDQQEAQQASQATLQAQQAAVAAASQNPGSTAGQTKTPCLYSAITAKDPWTCPVTGFVHFGMLDGPNGPLLDSRSERVFLSAGKESDA